MAPPPPSPQQPQVLLAGMAGTSTSTIGTFIKNEMTEGGGILQQQTNIIFNPNDLNARTEMVKQFCVFSGMKPDWSEKCLQDCAWSWEVRNY